MKSSTPMTLSKNTAETNSPLLEMLLEQLALTVVPVEFYH